MSLGTLLGIVLSGLIVGSLARFAVPGPDPMPIWKTILFGVAGSLIGGGIGYSIGEELGGFMGSVVVATLLIILYRRFVQKRPITGPEARRKSARSGTPD